MAVRTDAAKEEVYASSLAYESFVVVALGDEVWSVAVQNMHILRFDVYVAEEVVPHEAVVAFRVVFR